MGLTPCASNSFPTKRLESKELGVQRILFIVAFYKVLQRKDSLKLKLAHLKAERNENYELLMETISVCGLQSEMAKNTMK